MVPEVRPAETAADAGGDSSQLGRWLLTWLLAVGLAVLTPLAIAGSWARGIVFDTERYVATVAPLVHDPAFQADLTDQISTQVLAALDVDTLVDQALEALSLDALPLDDAAQALDRLLSPVVSGLEDSVRTGVGRVVSSDAFATAWEEANRTGHEQIVGALTGDAGLVEVSGNQVTMRSEVFLDAVRAGLDDAGLGTVAGLIPRSEASFVLFESDALAAVQAALRLLDVVGAWMWVVALLVAAGVVLAAPRWRSGLMVAAASVVVGTLLLAALLALARSALVGGSDLVLVAQASEALFDQMVAVLRLANRAVLTVALLVLLGAWLVGLRADPVTAPAWVNRFRRPLQVGAVAVGAVVLVLLPEPSGWTALLVAALVLAPVIAVELLVRPRRPQPT